MLDKARICILQARVSSCVNVCMPHLNTRSLLRFVRRGIGGINDVVADQAESIAPRAAAIRATSVRARLETALRESERKYRSLYENIPLIYITLAKDCTIRTINALGAKDLGYESDELIERSVHTFVHPDDRPAVEQQLAAAATTPEAIECSEARLVCKVGSIKWVSAASRMVHGADGDDLVLLVCADITRRHRAEQQVIEQQNELSALAVRTALAEERERRRIANGLHDEIGHALTLAKLKLGQMQGSDQSIEGIRAIKDVEGLLDQAVRATRSLTFELSSPVLYELGIEAALESLGADMERQHGIRFQFGAGHPLPSMPDDMTVALYRIVRELLNNVSKHARARSVRLSIHLDGDEIRIALEDDGVGFDATAAGRGFGPGGGFGLFSIRAQLRHLGGHLEIESSPEGTRAVIVAPSKPIEDDME